MVKFSENLNRLVFVMTSGLRGIDTPLAKTDSCQHCFGSLKGVYSERMEFALLRSKFIPDREDFFSRS